MTKPFTDPSTQAPALQSLDTRSRDIFRRIVDSFLRDGEPVDEERYDLDEPPASAPPATPAQ